MKTIKAILIERLNENKADLQEHETLKAALATHEGKAITKIARYLPEGWEFESRYSMFHAIAPNGNRHLLGYDSNNIFTVAGLERCDGAYFEGSKGRISQLESFLNNPDRLKQLLYL